MLRSVLGLGDGGQQQGDDQPESQARKGSGRAHGQMAAKEGSTKGSCRQVMMVPKWVRSRSGSVRHGGAYRRRLCTRACPLTTSWMGLTRQA